MELWVLLLLGGVVSFFAVNAFVGWATRRREARLSALVDRLRDLAGSSVRTPVTLVTGFLGSGKTTLLNNLLRSPPRGVRLAVIENERGAIPLDHELLLGSHAAGSGGGGAPSPSPENLRLLVLSNGCMCCSSPESAGRDDLERSLEVLLELGDGAAAAAAVGMDHIVIETSGVADPAPLVHALLAIGAKAAGRFYLAGVVAVADAANLAYHLDAQGLLSRSGEAGRQLAFADLVLLNKEDAASPAAREAALHAVRRCNPTARVHPCTQARVPAEVVLDCGALDPRRALEALGGALVDTGAPPPPAQHTPRVTTLALPQPSPTADGSASGSPLPGERALLDWLGSLVREHERTLYRVKGVVACREGGGKGALFIQGVHGALQVAKVPLASLGKGGQKRVQLGLVFIGLCLPREDISRGWEALLAP